MALLILHKCRDKWKDVKVHENKFLYLSKDSICITRFHYTREEKNGKSRVSEFVHRKQMVDILNVAHDVQNDFYFIIFERFSFQI